MVCVCKNFSQISLHVSFCLLTSTFSVTGPTTSTTWSCVCGSAFTHACNVFCWFSLMPVTLSNTWHVSQKRVSLASSPSYLSLMQSRRWWVTCWYLYRDHYYLCAGTFDTWIKLFPQVQSFKYYPINRGFKPDYITAYKCECLAPDQGKSPKF